MRTAPEFAVQVEERFNKYAHKVLATLRKDGSPRVSGIEAAFENGELWLGLWRARSKPWTCAGIRGSLCTAVRRIRATILRPALSLTRSWPAEPWRLSARMIVRGEPRQVGCTGSAWISQRRCWSSLVILGTI